MTSAVELDEWGRIVLGRVVRATWALWSLLASLHVVFWSTEHRVDALALAPAGLLVLARWLPGERHVWALVLAILAFAAAKHPAAFSACAFACAAALALRAFTTARASSARTVLRAVPSTAPYRAGGDELRHEEVAVSDGLPGARRLASGAMFLVYLGAWTLDWRGGAFPAHVLALDTAFAVVVALVVSRWRVRAALVPLAATWAHFGAHLVPVPRTTLEWGGASIVLGFALLFASLGASFALRTRSPTSRRPGGP